MKFRLNSVCSKVQFLFLLSVIEVASGDCGVDVIPRLAKAWRVCEEEMNSKRSLTTCSDSSSYDSRKQLVTSMLGPDCKVKTSASQDSIIHAASQTKQVNVRTCILTL